ncbi:MAG: hypothetical protein AABY32_02710 [Nanoarchaeota archaeon]
MSADEKLNNQLPLVDEEAIEPTNAEEIVQDSSPVDTEEDYESWDEERFNQGVEKGEVEEITTDDLSMENIYKDLDTTAPKEEIEQEIVEQYPYVSPPEQIPPFEEVKPEPTPEIKPEPIEDKRPPEEEKEVEDEEEKIKDIYSDANIKRMESVGSIVRNSFNDRNIGESPIVRIDYISKKGDRFTADLHLSSADSPGAKLFMSKGTGKDRQRRLILLGITTYPEKGNLPKDYRSFIMNNIISAKRIDKENNQMTIASDLLELSKVAHSNKLYGASEDFAEAAMRLHRVITAQYVGVTGYWLEQERFFADCYADNRKNGKMPQEACFDCLRQYQEKHDALSLDQDNIKKASASEGNLIDVIKKMAESKNKKTVTISDIKTAFKSMPYKEEPNFINYLISGINECILNKREDLAKVASSLFVEALVKVSDQLPEGKDVPETEKKDEPVGTTDKPITVPTGINKFDVEDIQNDIKSILDTINGYVREKLRSLYELPKFKEIEGDRWLNQIDNTLRNIEGILNKYYSSLTTAKSDKNIKIAFRQPELDKTKLSNVLLDLGATVATYVLAPMAGIAIAGVSAPLAGIVATGVGGLSLLLGGKTAVTVHDWIRYRLPLKHKIQEFKDSLLYLSSILVAFKKSLLDKKRQFLNNEELAPSLQKLEVLLRDIGNIDNLNKNLLSQSRNAPSMATEEDNQIADAVTGGGFSSAINQADKLTQEEFNKRMGNFQVSCWNDIKSMIDAVISQNKLGITLNERPAITEAAYSMIFDIEKASEKIESFMRSNKNSQASKQVISLLFPEIFTKLINEFSDVDAKTSKLFSKLREQQGKILGKLTGFLGRKESVSPVEQPVGQHGKQVPPVNVPPTPEEKEADKAENELSQQKIEIKSSGNERSVSGTPLFNETKNNLSSDILSWITLTGTATKRGKKNYKNTKMHLVKSLIENEPIKESANSVKILRSLYFALKEYLVNDTKTSMIERKDETLQGLATRIYQNLNQVVKESVFDMEKRGKTKPEIDGVIELFKRDIKDKIASENIVNKNYFYEGESKGATQPQKEATIPEAAFDINKWQDIVDTGSYKSSDGQTYTFKKVNEQKLSFYLKNAVGKPFEANHPLARTLNKLFERKDRNKDELNNFIDSVSKSVNRALVSIWEKSLGKVYSGANIENLYDSIASKEYVTDLDDLVSFQFDIVKTLLEDLIDIFTTKEMLDGINLGNKMSEVINEVSGIKNNIGVDLEKIREAQPSSRL